MLKPSWLFPCVISVLASTLLGAAAHSQAVGRTTANAGVSATGAANYSIPITVPKGTNGLTPDLALVYDSRAGDGLFGVGFNLSGLSTITRCNKTIAQDSVASKAFLAIGDGYCLNGNRLRLTGGTYGGAGSTYQTELETFTRVTAVGAAGNGPSSWEAYGKDGLIYAFGATGDSRIESLAVGGGQVASVREWAISSVRDRSGNTISFVYIEDTTNGSYRPSEIRWTTNANQGITTAPYRVVFSYETSQRPDPLTGYQYGDRYVVDGRIVELRRADYIDVYYNSTLVRRYDVSYGTAGAGGKSRLQSIQECGVGGTQCFPATTFTWLDGTASWNAEVSTGQSVPAAAAMFMDINGDGRDDVVYSSSTTSGGGYWYYMLSNGSGFNAPVSTGISNANFSSALPIEWDGDGSWDLLVPYNGSTWWVIRANGSGFDSPSNTGVAWFASERWWVADTNGDGRGDLVHGNEMLSYIEVKVRLQQGGAFGAETLLATVYGQEQNTLFPGAFGTLQNRFRSSNKQPDFNGDGREDMVYQARGYTYDSEFPISEFSFGIISGAGGAGFLYTDSYTLGSPTPVPIWATGDLNGDGLSDLVYIRNSTNTLYVLYSRGGWVNAVAGPSISGMTNASLAIADWDGDGLDDILIDSGSTLMVSRSNGQSLSAFASTGVSTTAGNLISIGDVNGDGLDDIARTNSGGAWASRLHQGVYPDLLDRATDGFGVFADFNYQSTASTGACHAREGAAPTYPKRRHTGAIYTVCTLDASNGIGGTYTVTYNYYNANRDQLGRGFLGFGRRQWRDNRDNIGNSATYSQDFPYVGMTTYHLRSQPAGTAIEDVTNTPASHSYGSGARMLPYISQSVARDYEVGGAYNGQLLRTATTTNTVSSASGTTTDSTTTVVEGNNANGLYAGQSHTTRTYHSALFDDFGNWCFGRPATTQQINSHTLPGGSPVTRTANITWNGLACRPSQVAIEPGNTQWQVATDYGYDGFGNINSVLVQPASGQGQTNRTTTINWGATGQFPMTVTNPKSQIQTFGYDFSLGVRTSVSDLREATDPSPLYTTSQLDEFGRVNRVTRPDGTATDFTLSWCNTAGCQGVDTTQRTQIAQIERDTSNVEITRSRHYFDMLDREVWTMTKVQSGADSTTRTIYDALGRVSQVSTPWLPTDAVWYTTTYYDILGRPTLIRRPKQESNTANHDTTFSYEGLRTTITNARNYTNREVRSAIGAVVQTIDSGNSDTDYEYDAFGNLLKTRDFYGNEITLTYNVRGMRMTSADPDMGSWSYNYYPVGELKTQTDAKSQTTTFTYDLLSRLLTRVEAEGTTTFTYDTGTKGVGKTATASSPGGYSESYLYDSLGRPAQTNITADSSTYSYNYSYSTATGQLETLTYPTSSSGYRFKLRYGYEYGLLTSINNYVGDVLGATYWRGQGMNARGQFLLEDYGNGLSTSALFDRITGMLLAKTTGPSGGTTIQNLSYQWDENDNLTQRQDSRTSVTETFSYDALDRMYSSNRNGSLALSVGYDAIGNITSKTGVGNYTYHTTKKHAVASTSGTLNNTYGYDNNGNMTSRNGFTTTWYSYNLPRVINGSGVSSEFFYGPNRDRWKQVRTNSSGTGTWTYVGPALERLVTANVNEFRHYVYGPNGPVAVYKRNQAGTASSTGYLTTDHLGSTDVMTSTAGSQTVNMSFNAFGERKGADGISAPTAADQTAYKNFTARGFTFHEQLDDLSLVHMNGRVYDPVIGRFTSADPFIQAPYFSQSLNRYSYAFNNPLSYTDPSGFGNETLRWEMGPGLGGWADTGGQTDSSSPLWGWLGNSAITGNVSDFLWTSGSREPESLFYSEYSQNAIGSHVAIPPSDRGPVDTSSNVPSGPPAGTIPAGSATSAAGETSGVVDLMSQRVVNFVRSGFFRTDAEIDAWGAGLMVARDMGPEATSQYLRENPMFTGTKTAMEMSVGIGGTRAALGTAPFARMLEGHAAGQGFTGVYDTGAGQLLLRPSTSATPLPPGWAARAGGHGAVSATLGGTANHAGFAVIIQADGSLAVTWVSRTLNRGPAYLVPPELRPSIVEAIERATGRTVSQY
ncbi:FG-GAP-like repeat-containing protein [Peristeroidobacter soli]|uniref:FG-GAP-like repeat-containing protein n=1 Tax=Peristeroidobacter soli TaxID=2497877 RepID=UPI00101CFDB9|nr:FG-GAP-like repeat-containing protein [Peristeroidobacter soli]